MVVVIDVYEGVSCANVSSHSDIRRTVLLHSAQIIHPDIAMVTLARRRVDAVETVLG